MGERVEPVRALRLMTWSAFWAIVAVALWFLADWILMADRGLDLGDEALYLLAADTRSPTAAFVFPFGWHTRPIYNLVGGDVAAFRTAGAVVLAGVGLWVGMSAARLIGAARDRADRFVTAAAAITGLAGSWLFYFTLLRAPGYNWVTIVGMGIAAGAALRQWARHIDPERNSNVWADRALIVVIGFGTVFTLAAKPTTPIFIGITYAITAVSIVGVKHALRALAWIIAASFLWIPILIIIGWWPWNFVEVFFEAVQRPLVTEQQSPPQALLNLASIPGLAYQDFRGVAAGPVALAALAFLALTTAAVKRWRHPRILLVPFIAILLVTPAFAANTLEVWQQGWERGNLVVALLMVVAAALVVGLGRWEPPQPLTRVQLSLAVASIVLLTGAFGFSSTNTPYPMIKFAAVLLAAAALIPLARVPDAFIRRTIALLLALAAVSTATHLILVSQSAPYSSKSLDSQTVPVEVGLQGSVVLVDPGKAQPLTSIRKVIQEAGGSSIHLIAIGPDTPGVALGSGATMPDSIKLSWFGLPGDIALAEANLSRVDSPEWCDAWLLTHPLRDQTAEIASLFANFTGRAWPGDYTLATQEGRFSLWSPTVACEPQADSTD